MKLDLDIDRLTASGTTPFSRHQIAAALEQELDRLVRAHGLPFGDRSGEVDVDQAALHVTPGSSPAEVGVQVARQLFTGLKRQAADIVHRGPGS